jgi:hypothetical protein
MPLSLSVLDSNGGTASTELRDHLCYCAGFTGRDRAAVDAHLAELAREGIPAPEQVPACYPVVPELVLVDDRMPVFDVHTSGEVEPVLVVVDGRIRYLGLGSDHTDRYVERFSIPHAKNICPKPMARQVWRAADVAPHWDSMELLSWIDGEPYQRGTLAELLPCDELVALTPAAPGRTVVIFGGTVAAHGGLRTDGAEFRASLRDPVLGRELLLSYRTAVTA